MKRVLPILLSLIMVITCLSACKSDSSSDSKEQSGGSTAEKMTIMMYVVGSDLESGGTDSYGGCATEDINEILSSDFDVDKINYLIYTGGANMWRSDISANYNSTFIVTSNNGKKELKLLDKESSYKDMANPDTLAGFMNYACENYPADRYGLILWNHGGGPIQGYGYDEKTNNMLALSQFKEAFDATSFSGSSKLDFIGFDACLMGSVEIGTTLKDYADYMIASEEFEPGWGWDYRFLSDIDCTSDIKDISGAIIDHFYSKNQIKEYYKKYNPNAYYVEPNETLSCVDLQKVDALNTAIDGLFKQFNELLDSPYANRLLTDRRNVFTFGYNEKYPGTESDLVDIGALADVCSSQFPDETAEILSALEDYVVYAKSDIQPSYGAALYYPLGGVLSFREYGINTFSEYTDCPEYVKFIKEYTSRLYQNYVTESDYRQIPKRTYSALDNIKADQDAITVTLSDEQKANFVSAYVNVLRKGVENEGVASYVPVTLRQQVKQDSDGNLSIGADVAIPVVDTGSEEIVWPMQVIQNIDDSAVYQTLNTYVAASGYEQANTIIKPVVIASELKEGDTELTLTGIYYKDSEQPVTGKSSVNTLDWNCFCDYEISKYEERGDSGEMLPFEAWETEGSIGMTMMDYSENFSIKMKPLSELDNKNYYYQIVMEDSDGKCYSSDLVECSVGVKSEEAVEKTASGELTYRVYSDHAEAVKYSGTDKKLTIPAEYKGVPVTKICADFIDINNDSVVGELVIEGADTVLARRCLYHAAVDQVTLPDGMKSIGTQAFYGSYVKKITLPESLEEIGDKAFAECELLEELTIPASVSKIGVGAFAGTLPVKEITIASGNKDYKIEEKSLLSADGTVLYARFDGKETYQVPDGVEIIERYACVGDKYHGDRNINDNLTSVELPDSVKTICSDAFRNNRLTALTIPDSVEYIANGAFADYVNYDVTISELKIGKGLRFLGDGVFDGITVENVEVSEENAYFSSVDGKLMNKAGDAEIRIGK